MRIRPITRFLAIGGVAGVFLPFLFSICLFSESLGSFVAVQPPTPGYYSGAPTALPTRVPSRVQAWTGTALSSGGGAGFIVWSLLGAFAGEGIAVRRWGRDWNATGKAWLGAAVGSLVFMAITLCGFLR